MLFALSITWPTNTFYQDSAADVLLSKRQPNRYRTSYCGFSSPREKPLYERLHPLPAFAEQCEQDQAKDRPHDQFQFALRAARLRFPFKVQQRKLLARIVVFWNSQHASLPCRAGCV